MPLSFLGLLKWFIAVVSVFLLSGLARSTAQGQTLLTGGGATFPHPIYARWIAEYQKLHPDIEIEYQAIGSGAGIREITAGVFDFGASDGPMDDAQLKEYRAKRGMAILPFQLYWAQMYRSTTFLEWLRNSNSRRRPLPGSFWVKLRSGMTRN